MSFCIFIASSTATTSPSFTSSPALIGIFTINPCIGAITVPSPDLGVAFAGEAAAGAASPPGDAIAGITAMPAPVTRTLNTSPSTSTSNSAVVVGGAAGGGGSGAGGGSGGAVVTATD